MKTSTIMICTILLFLNGCGGENQQQDPTSPPVPSTTNSDITPPASPTLE
jgi:PBP1b-binding outer membrane lipoprotein LpoB